MNPRPAVALLIAALLTGVVLTGVVLAGATTATAADRPTYVALGDSYAAGFGLPSPAVPTGAPGCTRTSLNYPNRVATSLGLDLTDVTCSGAVTADLTKPQAGVPPQLDALDGGPDLVTLTIGGNDLGFAAIARDCLASSPTGPLFGPGRASFDSCRDYFAADAGRADDPELRLADVQQQVGAAIRAVGAAAPGATVVVVGYPAIAPDAANTPAGGCFAANRLAPPVPVDGVPLASAFPFTDDDVPYLQELQQRFEAGIEAQAGANGATYSSVYTASLTRSACAPVDTRWVEPVAPGGGGTNALHPSAAGTQAMADALAAAVGTQRPSPASVTVPPTTPPVAAPPTTPITAVPIGPAASQPPRAPEPTTEPGLVALPTLPTLPTLTSRFGPRSPVAVVAPPVGAGAVTLAATGPAPVGAITTLAVGLLLGGTGLVVAGTRRRR